MFFNNNLNQSRNFNFNNNNNNSFVQNINMNQTSNQLALSNRNNNVISTNVNSQANPDGTITEIKTLIFQNGDSATTKTIYDQKGNIIHKEILDQGNANNPNNNIQRTVDAFGNVTETRTNIMPNGSSSIMRITRDRNGNVISQSSSSTFGNGNANNFMNSSSFNNNANFNNNFNNNMQSIVQSNNNMIPNNFNMGMNNLFNSMSMMMNNMNNMFMNNMNYMNNMFMNMNNLNNLNNMLMNNMNNMQYNNMGNMNQGIEPSLLNNLNVTSIQDSSKLEKEKGNCVICLDNFKNGDEIIYLPCLHVFHKNCLLEWFRGHNFCPICKFKMTYENLNRK